MSVMSSVRSDCLSFLCDALLLVCHYSLWFAEDVAIAYGYNKIPTRIPRTQTVGRQLPINAL